MDLYSLPSKDVIFLRSALVGGVTPTLINGLHKRMEHDVFRCTFGAGTGNQGHVPIGLLHNNFRKGYAEMLCQWRSKDRLGIKRDSCSVVGYLCFLFLFGVWRIFVAYFVTYFVA